MINQYLGGANIGPWDVEELPEDIIDAFRGLVEQLGKYQKSEADIERKFAERRARHPSYRK